MSCPPNEIKTIFTFPSIHNVRRLADCNASRTFGFDWRQRGCVLQWLVFFGVAVQCF